jgi:hypothetical protein
MSAGPSKPWQNDSYDNNMYYNGNMDYNSNVQRTLNNSDSYYDVNNSRLPYNNSNSPRTLPFVMSDFSNIGETIRQLAQYLSNLSYSLHSLLSSIDSIRFIFIQNHFNSLITLIYDVMQKLKSFAMSKNKTVKRIIFLITLILFYGAYSMRKVTRDRVSQSFKVLKDFSLQDPNFLEIHKGETVTVDINGTSGNSMNDWIYGRKDNGQSGYFPRSHIII